MHTMLGNLFMRGLQFLALAAVAFLCVELGWTVHKARPKVLLTIENSDRAMIAAGAAAGNLEEASRQWELASKAQIDQSTAVLSSTKDTLASLRTLVSRTDASLNDSVLPNLAAAVKDQNRALLETQQQLQSNLLDMQRATATLQATLTDADALIADPAIKDSVNNLAQASRNTAEATKEASATMADIRGGVEYEIKKLEAPVTKLKAAASVALTILRKLFF